jgi:hypothetical protein
VTESGDPMASAGVLDGGLSDEDAGAVWQPFVDRPLLTPQMILGVDDVAPNDVQRLRRYLAALVAARRGPVHVNVAFNACYFGYDLTQNAYVGGALNDLFSFPTVDVSSTCETLPVGALVNITAGAHPLFAEVVYKEGAHPDLREDGSLPDWVSGAPATAAPPGAAPEGAAESAQDAADSTVLRERLVVDVDAFGADLSLSPEQLARIRRHGRGLDRDGHLLLDARYRSRAEADLDDVSFYAKYLLSTGREQVLSASAPMPLAAVLTEDAGEPELEAALLGLLRTIEQALAEIGELRLWRGYAFTRASLGARLRDTGPLGGADLGSLAVELGRQAVPSANRRFAPARTVAYTAIGPRLRASTDAETLLAGVGYATAVCHANSVVADYARRDVDGDGLLPDDVHLRLDDPWQGGGVWRAERPGSPWVNVDVTQPLGLGWLSTVPGALEPPPSPAPDAPPDGPEPDEPVEHDESEAGDATLLTVTNSQTSWSQPLRLRHQLQARLPLPELVANQIRTTGGPPRLRLMLNHDGYDLDIVQAQQETVTELYGPTPDLSGIDWPLEFFPGIILTCTWPRGGSVVRATSTLLDAPVTVDGFEIEHRYDASILTRDTAPGAPQRTEASAGGSTPAAGTLTLAERILRAVRRLGLLSHDGTAVLARTHLAPAVYGAETPGSDTALDEAVGQLIDSAALNADVAGVRPGGQLEYPAASGSATTPVLVYTPQVAVGTARPGRRFVMRRLEARFVRATDVTGHLRYIAHLGWEAGEAARRAYREDRARLGLAGPAELPAGYTYVSPFRRGG